MAREWTAIYRRDRWIGVKPRRWLARGLSSFYVLTRTVRYRMSALSHRGIRIAGWERLDKPGGSPVGPVVWAGDRPNMKKVKKADRAAVKHLAALESEVLRDLMSLVEHCALMQYDDGEPREPGWITIRTTGAAWQIVVKDPDSGSSFTSVGRSIDEALSTAALLLGCEEAPWEPDAYLMASAKRKGKK